MGSSARIRVGSLIRQRARQTRLFPPESSAGRCSIRSARPTRRRSSRPFQRRTEGLPYHPRAGKRFPGRRVRAASDRTERRTRRDDCGIPEGRRRWSRLEQGSFESHLPGVRTVQSTEQVQEGAFPAPEAPLRARNSPCCTVRSTPGAPPGCADPWRRDFRRPEASRQGVTHCEGPGRVEATQPAERGRPRPEGRSPAIHRR